MTDTGGSSVERQPEERPLAWVFHRSVVSNLEKLKLVHRATVVAGMDALTRGEAPPGPPIQIGTAGDIRELRINLAGHRQLRLLYKEELGANQLVALHLGYAFTTPTATGRQHERLAEASVRERLNDPALSEVVEIPEDRTEQAAIDAAAAAEADLELRHPTKTFTGLEVTHAATVLFASVGDAPRGKVLCRGSPT